MNIQKNLFIHIKLQKLKDETSVFRKHQQEIKKFQQYYWNVDKQKGNKIEQTFQQYDQEMKGLLILQICIIISHQSTFYKQFHYDFFIVSYIIMYSYSSRKVIFRKLDKYKINNIRNYYFSCWNIFQINIQNLKYILKSYVYQVLINNSHQFNSIKVYIQTNINDCRMIIKLIIVFNINQKLEGLQDHFELTRPKRKKSFKFSKLNNIKPFQQKNSQNSFRMIDNLNQTVLIKPPEINQDSSLIQLFIFFERIILTIDYIQI
ncbi:unnamed protein product (macronuclear) [Paramecium tetraurelia]|uniref:Transmembrane protein n=1 Tax=Paramecium tetraurelia TaxID=5888 RepID=A0DF41_PARTE|nr:uncharacterized protein GSPATT00016471001 [Paramecium tetraurelia]CAK81658.1 unnamed protein product [Paramecium tetraurelia]|eukprot:XP_001449055.1 hypothetical protein (macronuclear) [Paramecium tetraurelia strain d4-2]